jgi:cell wall-associated NlpC family hydrolase/LysM repeat protein
MVISGALAAALLMNQPGYVPAKLYRFKEGDTLAKVAQLNSTGYERLMAANPDLSPAKIRPGMVVVVPARVPKGALKPLAEKIDPKARGPRTTRNYAIRNGDTDWSIAGRVGIAPSALRKMNPGTDWKKLQLGQEIKIPNSVDKAAPRSATVAKNKPAPNKAASTPKVSTTVVKKGDNDWIIASRYDMRPSDLRRLNPGVDWTRIKPGQTLNVTGARSTTSRSAAVASMPVIKSKRVAFGKDSVNIRAGGRINSRVVTQAAKGELASVVDRIDDWYKVRLGTGKSGWVRGDMLKAVRATDVASPAPLAKSESGRGRLASSSPVARRGTSVVIARDNVNVRTGGKTTSRVRTTVAQGTKATVLGPEGDWVKVRFSTGLTGYVRGDMLKKAAPTIVAQAAPRNAAARPAASNRTTVARRTETLPAVPRRTTTTAKKPSGNTRTVASLSPRASGGLLSTASTWMGTRYRWGGTSRSGADCSGFTSSVFKSHGVSIPRTSIAQSRAGAAVSKDSLKPGDLVFFKTRGNRVSHVGIYKGGGKFIHASSGKGRVTVNSLSEGYYSRRYAGARRVTGVKETPSRSSSSARTSQSKSTERLKPVQAAREDQDAMKQAEKQLKAETPAPKPAPAADAPTNRVQPGTDVTGP